jgi:hypothetical protein
MPQMTGLFKARNLCCQWGRFSLANPFQKMHTFRDFCSRNVSLADTPVRQIESDATRFGYESWFFGKGSYLNFWLGTCVAALLEISEDIPTSPAFLLLWINTKKENE